MKSLPTTLLLVLLSLAFSQAQEDNGDVLCPCLFDGNDDVTCRVYGQLGDDILIPWHKGSQDCLDIHNIKISAIPPFQLESICNPPNANSFVNYLRFESTAASTSIKQGYGQFWDGDANPITLVDSIDSNGTPVDCETNASGCWTAIKTYFEDNPDEIVSNCQTLYNTAAKDLDAEQSVLRIAICNDEVDGSTECGSLQTQVEEFKVANPSKACSAFGLGPISGGEKPPTCDTDNAPDDSSSALRLLNISALLGLIAAVVATGGAFF